MESIAEAYGQERQPAIRPLELRTFLKVGEWGSPRPGERPPAAPQLGSSASGYPYRGGSAGPGWGNWDGLAGGTGLGGDWAGLGGNWAGLGWGGGLGLGGTGLH